MDGSDSLSCGICLSDNGKAIRGQIDSCEHYFCFVCIMEWAKVESRCPMCKRRFTTIRRPPKDGVFSSERVVDVPKRDQVYHLLGNATVGSFDPYTQVQCNVCHSAKDESLLLLCDLCDSAAHTYCVGLGATVPEGDWFCHDCAVSRTEHDNMQNDNDDINQNLYVKSEVMLAAEPSVSTLNVANDQSTSENSNDMVVDEVDVSIFDIIRESETQLFNRGQTRFYPVPFHRERQSSLADEMTQPGEKTYHTGSGERTPQSNVDMVIQTGARTLSRCRNVHSYIRVLRENWSSLQSGSLKFSSSSPESSSKSGQQLTSKDTPDILTQGRRYNDIDKAWKMMDKAKSIQEAYRRTKSVHLVPTNSTGKGKRKAIDGSANLHLSRSQRPSFDSRRQQLGTIGLEDTMNKERYKLYSPEKHTEKHPSPKLEMQRHFMVATKGIVKCCDSAPTTSLSGFSASVSSCKVQASNKNDVCQCRASLDGDQKIGSGLMTTWTGSVPGTSKSLNTKADLSATSSFKVDIPEGDVRLEKGVIGSKVRKDDDAKSEIQSLVKLNLKLLNRDKKLEINAFKEVARLSTHTILAACGFVHSRHVFHSFPGSVCSHSERIQQFRKSTLMPNSCRECFYVFVKDVVNSILSDKLSLAKS